MTQSCLRLNSCPRCCPCQCYFCVCCQCSLESSDHFWRYLLRLCSQRFCFGIIAQPGACQSNHWDKETCPYWHRQWLLLSECLCYLQIIVLMNGFRGCDLYCQWCCCFRRFCVGISPIAAFSYDIFEIGFGHRCIVVVGSCSKLAAWWSLAPGASCSGLSFASVGPVLGLFLCWCELFHFTFGQGCSKTSFSISFRPPYCLLRVGFSAHLFLFRILRFFHSKPRCEAWVATLSWYGFVPHPHSAKAQLHTPWEAGPSTWKSTRAPCHSSLCLRAGLSLCGWYFHSLYYAHSNPCFDHFLPPWAASRFQSTSEYNPRPSDYRTWGVVLSPFWISHVQIDQFHHSTAP